MPRQRKRKGKGRRRTSVSLLGTRGPLWEPLGIGRRGRRGRRAEGQEVRVSSSTVCCTEGAES